MREKVFGEAATPGFKICFHIFVLMQAVDKNQLDGLRKRPRRRFRKLHVRHDHVVHAGSLDVVVNNAGYGLWGKFEELSLEEQLNMMQLNMQSLVSLTYELLPLLKEQKKSYLLNLASTAAYQAQEMATIEPTG